MLDLVVTIDDSQVVEFLRATEQALTHFASDAAKELQSAAASESAEASSRVSSSWTIEGSAQEPDVVSGMWWAHFLARGTSAHGPVEAPALVFNSGGDTVFAQFVSGIGADPFHERAIHDVETRVDEILSRSLAGVG